MNHHVEQFIARQWSVPPHRLRVDVQPIAAGLESAVALATVTPISDYPSLPARLVIKELRSGFDREAGVYQVLWHHLQPPPAARMHGMARIGGRQYLYLEHVECADRWPWRNTERAAEVCRVLAQLHDTVTIPRESVAWAYENRLHQTAEETLQMALWAREPGGRRYWRRIGDLRRVVGALGTIRSRLLASGTTVIHGDMHPGNVILKNAGNAPQVALIDWGRARIGSPLEDVASWLHSLGCWEPQVRRQHDALLRAYLSARQLPCVLTPELRRHYSFASASNGLAGAICHHLTTLTDDTACEAQRWDAGRALFAWQRVIRRAAGECGPFGIAKRRTTHDTGPVK